MLKKKNEKINVLKMDTKKKKKNNISKRTI